MAMAPRTQYATTSDDATAGLRILGPGPRLAVAQVNPSAGFCSHDRLWRTQSVGEDRGDTERESPSAPIIAAGKSSSPFSRGVSAPV